jgi:hypothetical protein
MSLKILRKGFIMKRAVGFLSLGLLFVGFTFSACGKKADEGATSEGSTAAAAAAANPAEAPAEKAVANPGLCAAVYANATKLAVPGTPPKEQWDAACAALPKPLLDCAAKATTPAEFGACGKPAPAEGVDKALCDKVFEKGVELKIEGAPSKEQWDAGCPTLPKAVLDCAANAKDAAEFQGCAK